MVLAGGRNCIVIGGVLNTIYIVLLIFTPSAIPIYVFSIFIGIGGGLIWVGKYCSTV